MQNSAGLFIKPTLKSLQQAATLDIPKDGIVSCVFGDSKHGYPLTSFSWIILYKEQAYANKTIQEAINVYGLFDWIIENSQDIATITGYAHLPPNVQKIQNSLLSQVTFKNKKIAKLKTFD